MAFVAAEVDVFSNARVKIYPREDIKPVIQVSNAPIFRASGWEQERAYDVPPNGEGNDHERAVQNAKRRAAGCVRDIALCNQFTHMFTWTLDGSLIDRYDAQTVKPKVFNFLKNKVRRNGFAYVMVVEPHKDGALHFHGLCCLGSIELTRARSPKTGKLLYKKGRPIFNMLDWKWGYSSCVPLDENYECAVNYVAKYLTKDESTSKIFGKWYFASRNLQKRPEIQLVTGGMDYEAFFAEHPEKSPVTLYNDVKLLSYQLPQNGGASA